MRQAWREKVALCCISLFLCVFLGYFTFFFQMTTCPLESEKSIKASEASRSSFIKEGQAVMYGGIYDVSGWIPTIPDYEERDYMKLIMGLDLTQIFIKSDTSSCDGIVANVAAAKPCQWEKITQCTTMESNAVVRREVYHEWSEVLGRPDKLVFNGQVIDLAQYFAVDRSKVLTSDYAAYDNILRSHAGRDISMLFSKNATSSKVAKCFLDLYGIGRLEKEVPLCIASTAIQTIALVIISSLVFVKFALAWYFAFALSRQLGKIEASRSLFSKRPKDVKPVTAATHPQEFSLFHRPDFSIQYKELYTLCVVTCYSEGLDGLKTTLDSLALTDYSDQHKLIFIVADGVVKGSGNDKPTGDIVLDMIELDEAIHVPLDNEVNYDEALGQQKDKTRCSNAEPHLYEAIGTGPKKVNMAKVFCGTYVCKDRRVAVVLVYKCGTPAEASSAKPGNRGKRDSQIILMDFLSKVMFNERLSPLQFDLFTKLSHIMTVQNLSTKKVTPDMFEIVLMVDADTKVMTDSLSRMVAVMQRDPTVMGLCGETRIMNKADSYISMIQVFEYFVSHHLAKAFESIFGGVTCLPGCFCMYRIKSPKPIQKSELIPDIEPELQCTWIPVLANPDIVHDYSACVVDTLHKKNLLLLGEDRYLSTLMLRTFPKRKMMFVPKAICKTTVPNEFMVLLSQRRRWINSTIHNLMELVLVRELCGTFCFSMQFVVFLELVGTVTLPAAIIFTLIVCVVAIIGPVVPVVPLILLAAILGLPSLLIVMTTRNPVEDLFYMFVYFTSLPIWNFVLPVYAFWHFDDFSWGQTRQVAGEKKGDDGHGSSGKDDPNSATSVPLKLWAEWEMIRRKALQYAQVQDPFGVVTKYIDQAPKRTKKSSKLSQIAQKLGLKKDKTKEEPQRPSSAQPPKVRPSTAPIPSTTVKPPPGFSTPLDSSERSLTAAARPQTATVGPSMPSVRTRTSIDKLKVITETPEQKSKPSPIPAVTPTSAKLQSRPDTAAAVPTVTFTATAEHTYESPNPFDLLASVQNDLGNIKRKPAGK